MTLEAYGRGDFPGRRLPETDLIEVESLGVWDAHVEQTWSLELNSGDGIILFFVLAGALPFSTGQRTEELEAGDFAIMMPNELGLIGDPVVGPSSLVWVILSEIAHDTVNGRELPSWLLVDLASLASLDAMQAMGNRRSWRADMEIKWAFDRLCQFCRTDDDHSSACRLKVALNSLLMAVTSFTYSPGIGAGLVAGLGEGTHKGQKVRAFLDQLQARCDEAWTLESMAEDCGLGRSAFTTLCRQDTNMTPIEFLTSCRLKRSRELLQNHREMSVTEAAFACGFHSSQYFATVFRRAYGQTPREWRSKNPH